MAALVFANIFFALLLGIFLLVPVASNWAWLVLIVSWCVVEGWLSKNSDLKWRHFTILFTILAGLELTLVWYSMNWR
jgi:hypothetical protein